jgi:hypothetical protein
VFSHENRLKNVLFTANNVILRFFFLRKTKFIHKFIKPTKKIFRPKQKNTCLVILNHKPNCQVSRILMNPRPILSDSSENHPTGKLVLLKSTVKIDFDVHLAATKNFSQLNEPSFHVQTKNYTIQSSRFH